MLVPYTSQDSSAFYSDYYRKQIGHGISVFKGKDTMNGHGLGSLFSGLLKRAAPMLKRGAATVGKRLLSTGMGVLKDAIGGENVGVAAKRRFASAGGELLSDVTGQFMGESDGDEVIPPRKRSRQQTATTSADRRVQTPKGRQQSGVKRVGKKKRGDRIATFLPSYNDISKLVGFTVLIKV